MNIEGAIRLDDPRITEVTSLEDVFTHGIRRGQTVRIPASLFPGTDGREVELNADGGFLRWRYKGETSWQSLVPIEDLKGAKGDPFTFEDFTQAQLDSLKVEGPKGDPNTLTIGTVTEGENATASITGTAPNQVLNLTIPKPALTATLGGVDYPEIVIN